MFKQKNRRIILLVVIYLAFISLGLPDGILGVAWPSMRGEMNMPLESVSILTTLLLFMSAASSIFSGKLLTKFGTGGVTFISGLMTGLALLGFAFSGSFLWLVALIFPLGLGQGAVDSGLNQYVAEHYTARHMNWLHCFWGVGASLGTLLMTRSLAVGSGWKSGYGTISAIQLGLSGILLISLLFGLWKNNEGHTEQPTQAQQNEQNSGLSGVWDQIFAITLFFIYTGVEFSMGLWINSVLVESRGVSVSLAGLAATAFYASIMAGRFLSGVVVNRIGNLRMIQLGMILAAGGSICAAVSPAYPGMILGVVLTGMGLAPVYPCLMHETPIRFTKKVSDHLIGIQVGAACLGGSILSSGTGMLMSYVSLELLFPILVILLAISFLLNQILTIRRNRI